MEGGSLNKLARRKGDRKHVAQWKQAARCKQRSNQEKQSNGTNQRRVNTTCQSGGRRMVLRMVLHVENVGEVAKQVEEAVGSRMTVES